MNESEITAALHALPSMSARTLKLILANLSRLDFQDWETEDLIKVGIEAERAKRVMQELASLDPIPWAMELQAHQIQVVTLADKIYPARLREISSPPPVLYVRGNAELLSTSALAVVGTRHPTPYGINATRALVSPVAKSGITIVSGLALGIDGVAHESALQAGGKTVAILGSGLDTVYPWQHADLAERIIAQGGALVSEFPLRSKPERHHFPQRNRIIAGLCTSTLLVEAGDKSGALITAKFALDANRDVLAVPGPITSPQSVGPHNWIRLGATLVRSANDILELYARPTQAELLPQPVPVFATQEHGQLYSFLSLEPMHIDVLVEKSRLEPSVVSAALALMEIRGIIRHLGSQYYIRA